MREPITSSLTSESSRRCIRESGAAQRAALLGLGIVLAGIHQASDLGLGLPGHYGLVWMAGIMAARQWSRVPWAATLAAAGYVGGTWAFTGLAAHGLTHALLYVVAAVAIDLAWHARPARIRHPVVAGLVGGSAFMLKPLLMLTLAALAGSEAGALRHGAVFPLVTHFCFGLTGAVIGTLAWRLARGGEARVR